MTDVVDVLYRSMWLIGALVLAAAVGVAAMKRRKHRSTER